MYAYFTREKHLFSRCYREELEKLTLLRLELPMRCRTVPRRTLRALRRSGVTVLLNGPENRFLPLLETGELYRRKAGELALLWLQQHKIDPETVVVGLLGRRWTGEMERSAAVLVPQVRGLALTMPEASEAEWSLQQRYGVSVFQGEGDLTLCFSPASAGEKRLLLGESRPHIPGIDFRWRSGELPNNAPADALLTALIRGGRMDWTAAEPVLSDTEKALDFPKKMVDKPRSVC